MHSLAAEGSFQENLQTRFESVRNICFCFLNNCSLRNAAREFYDVYSEPAAFLIPLELKVERKVAARYDSVDERAHPVVIHSVGNRLARDCYDHELSLPSAAPPKP